MWDDVEGVPINTFVYKAADLYGALAVLDQYDPCAHIPPDLEDRDCIHEQVRRRFRERVEQFKYEAIERFGGSGATRKK